MSLSLTRRHILTGTVRQQYVCIRNLPLPNLRSHFRGACHTRHSACSFEPSLPRSKILLPNSCIHFAIHSPPSVDKLHRKWHQQSNSTKQPFLDTGRAPAEPTLPLTHLERLTGEVARGQAAYRACKKRNRLKKKKEIADAHNIGSHFRQRKTGTRGSLLNSCVSAGLTDLGEPSPPAPSMPNKEQKKTLANTETRTPTCPSQRHRGV